MVSYLFTLLFLPILAFTSVSGVANNITILLDLVPLYYLLLADSEGEDEGQNGEVQTWLCSSCTLEPAQNTSIWLSF